MEGTVLSGDPKLSGRIDYQDGPATAGVFQAPRGDAQIRFPFTEHATVVEGAVTLKEKRGRPTPSTVSARRLHGGGRRRPPHVKSMSP